MENRIAVRRISRAALWSAALILAGCLAVPQTAAAQDDQRVTPSQSDAQTMQRPDNPPEPGVNTPDQSRDMDRRNDDMQDRDRAAQGYGHDQNDRDRDDMNHHGANQADVAQFNQFLSNHPNIAQDLQRNPGLASDHRYVASHEELQEFLKAHPDIRRELKENPQAVLSGDRDRHDRDRDHDRQDQERPPQL